MCLAGSLKAQAPRSDIAERVFELTNKYRQEHGLAPLKRHPALEDAARQHARDMLRRNFFSHRNPDGADLRDRLPDSRSIRVAGENLWRVDGWRGGDDREAAARIIKAWKGSAAHRKNLLNPAFTHMGVGAAQSGQSIRAGQVFASF
jgi:uncharacterized protein YkwD